MDYISIVNIYCQTHKYEFPVITYKKSGLDHKPLFTASCEFKGQITTGSPCFNKQLAKQDLCRMLVEMNNMNPLSNTPSNAPNINIYGDFNNLLNGIPADLIITIVYPESKIAVRRKLIYTGE